MILSVVLLCMSTVAHSTPITAPPPGIINPNVTPENIHRTICVPNYTDTIRPPVQYTNKLKYLQVEQREYVDASMTAYEEDHMVSLGIGGHPTHRENLWPMPYAGKCGAKAKDVLEDKLHRLVCSGKVELRDAQREMAVDWVAAYNKYIGKLSCK